MDQTADLHSALSFVIRRIAEQADLSGKPLSDEERLLLNHLPRDAQPTWDAESPMLVPRNIALERVCALGKAAYQHDLEMNPVSPDWEFAFAVFTLHGHPMGGLLQLAGMKPRRAKWDRFGLLLTALLPVVAVALLVWNAERSVFREVVIGLGCVAVMLWIFFAFRHNEKQRWREEVERSRPAIHSVSK